MRNCAKIEIVSENHQNGTKSVRKWAENSESELTFHEEWKKVRKMMRKSAVTWNSILIEKRVPLIEI